MSLHQVLVILHAACGSVVLFSAALAIISKIAPIAHRWHIRSGVAFSYAMIGIFLTGMPLAFLRNSVFTALIGIFSLYFVVMGWRYAKNRSGTPARIDWIIVSVMAISSALQVAGGAYVLATGNSIGVVPLVFGLIGGVSAWEDRRQLARGGVRGKQRVSAHFNRMLPATIAAVTAFLLLNFRDFQPAFVIWLAPTVILTPLIAWWDRRLRADRRPSGMPEEA